MSGYLIGSREINKMPLPPKADLAWWYQFYFATARGRAGYEQYRRDFGTYVHRVITGGIGHNLPQEAPQAFTQAVVDVDRY
jgi:pimeloyl-ACP methyl ester carboxylesterase